MASISKRQFSRDFYKLCAEKHTILDDKGKIVGTWLPFNGLSNTVDSVDKYRSSNIGANVEILAKGLPSTPRCQSCKALAVGTIQVWNDGEELAAFVCLKCSKPYKNTFKPL